MELIQLLQLILQALIQFLFCNYRYLPLQQYINLDKLFLLTFNSPFIKLILIFVFNNHRLQIKSYLTVIKIILKSQIMKHRSWRSTSRHDDSKNHSNSELTRYTIQQLEELETKYVMKSQFLKAEKIKRQKDDIERVWQRMESERKVKEISKTSADISTDIDLKITLYKTNWDGLFQELIQYFLHFEQQIKQKHKMQQHNLLKVNLETDDQRINQSKENVLLSNYHQKLNLLLKKKQYVDADFLKKTAMIEITDIGNRSQKMISEKIKAKLNRLKLKQEKQLNFFHIKMEEELHERVKKRDEILNMYTQDYIRLIKKAKKQKQHLIKVDQKTSYLLGNSFS